MSGKGWRDDFLEIGRVTRAHGLRGELRAFFLAGVPDSLAGIRDIRLDGPDGFEDSHIDRMRPRGNGFVVSLECCRDRDRAELLAGSGIWVDRGLLPSFPGSGFFWRGTIGLAVVTASGREVGRVVDVFAAGAGDILVIRGNGNEYLVPARSEFVAAIDARTDRIVITPPEGLLELYEGPASPGNR